jgi:cellulose 1,4-beta-cellobiosidase
MLVLFAAFSSCVLPGTAEVHPKLPFQKCTKAGCTTQNGAVVIDSEWRTITDSEGRNCMRSGSEWDTAVCNGPEDCAAKCQLNGFDYATASVSTKGNAVRLGFVNPDGSVGSRVYLFDEDAGKYVNFKLLNHEITFDVDTATLGCGTNGALYFSDMYEDGGSSKFPSNKAGAKYGTGYCDAQCPRDGKFIGNYANVGKKYGSCCFEWDVWEANKAATQWAAHPCNIKESAYVCESDCQQCDTSGCGWNPYRDDGSGKITGFYGPGKTVDSTKKFTVVTQYITDSGTDNGNLKEIRRLWIQNGKVYETPAKTAWNGTGNVDYKYMNDAYCGSNLGNQGYGQRGGDAAFTAAFKRNAILAMSLWTDGSMSWLDEGNRGDCSNPGGKDAVISANKNSYLEISNIKFGDIDTTY